MKKLLLLFIINPLLLFSQVQIGSDIDGEAADDRSGRSVSLSSDGSVVAIGAQNNDGNGDRSGHVRIYRNQSGVWTQVGQDIDGEVAGDVSGASVSLSSDGTVVAIGASQNGTFTSGSVAGHVRIYRNVSDVWTQVGQDIDGEAENDQSGSSVSLSSDGSVVAIGAGFNSSNAQLAGHVRIYRNINDVWTQVGQDIDGEAAFEITGFSVSLSSDGGVVAVGSPSVVGVGTSDPGYVRIYRNVSDVWTQVGLPIDGEAVDDQSGVSVSLSSDGSVVAIGANGNDGNGSSSGHVRIYHNLSDVWTQIGSDIDGEAEFDGSGFAVSLSSDGSVVAIGAHFNDGNGPSSGHVRIYNNIGDVWTQVGVDIDGEAEGDQSGRYLSLSSDGSVVAIGAYFNSDNLLRSGHVRLYHLNSVLSSDDFVLSQFNMYPNPTKESVTIELRQGLELQNIKFYTNLGQLISTSKNLKVDTSNLTTGFYFLEIETNKGKATKKLIIE